MKKVTIIMTVLIAVTIMTNAQIPNYNFENWSNGATSPPDGWKDQGSHHAGFYPTTQTTDKYFGTYAVRLENKITSTDTTRGWIQTIRNNAGGLVPAFPVTTRHNNLKGFYKYIALNGDSAQIMVYFSKTGFSGPYGYLLAIGQKIMVQQQHILRFQLDILFSHIFTI